MVAANKQIVIVRDDGVIEIRSHGLPPGSRAEVTVQRAKREKAVSENVFFSNQTVDQLAAIQGLTKIPPYKTLLGTWPDKTSDDGFEKAVGRWRRGVGARK